MFKLSDCLVIFILITSIYCWDVAIISNNEIQFLNKDGAVVDKYQDKIFRKLTNIHYDSIYDIFFIVDSQNIETAIFSWDYKTKILNPLVRKNGQQNITDITFDPMSKRLFWSDTNVIYWMSLIPGMERDGYGIKLKELVNEKPYGLVVDSCLGHLYWSNNWNVGKIMRSNIDGTNETSYLHIAKELDTLHGITIDNTDRSLYLAYDPESIEYWVKKCQLDNNSNCEVKVVGRNQIPKSISVDDDYIYWTNEQKFVWKSHKNGSEPIKFINSETLDITVKVDILKQIINHTECEQFSRIHRSKLSRGYISALGEVSIGTHCVNGFVANGYCECRPGFRGDRCQVSVCDSYCLFGYCNVDEKGQPKCSCPPGRQGQRCDNDLCYNYCLNNGRCKFSQEVGSAVCQCEEGFTGDRCQTVFVVETTPRAADDCNCSNTQNAILLPPNREYVDNCLTDVWDYRTILVIVLGAFSISLSALCTALIFKVVQLKRRPRIRKRIIVNKNMTPMTARPDAHQCEITIENCCNMNICETPCFEPRATIKPTFKDKKHSKEEKCNLISNMETPDDC